MKRLIPREKGPFIPSDIKKQKETPYHKEREPYDFNWKISYSNKSYEEFFIKLTNKKVEITKKAYSESKEEIFKQTSIVDLKALKHYIVANSKDPFETPNFNLKIPPKIKIQILESFKSADDITLINKKEKKMPKKPLSISYAPLKINTIKLKTPQIIKVAPKIFFENVQWIKSDNNDKGITILNHDTKTGVTSPTKSIPQDEFIEILTYLEDGNRTTKNLIYQDETLYLKDGINKEKILDLSAENIDKLYQFLDAEVTIKIKEIKKEIKKHNSKEVEHPETTIKWEKNILYIFHVEKNFAIQATDESGHKTKAIIPLSFLDNFLSKTNSEKKHIVSYPFVLKNGWLHFYDPQQNISKDNAIKLFKYTPEVKDALKYRPLE